MNIVSSSVTFAPIRWWAYALNAQSVVIDTTEHFGKMSYRSRYNISGANNPIQLSVPLVHGREQRIPMGQVLIHNADNWQVQHWRTLVSVYKRSPYWEFYEPSLEALFNTNYTYLHEFNHAAFTWAAKQLKANIPLSIAEVYLTHYPSGFIDLRGMKPSTDKHILSDFPTYYQLFEERIGFQPNLSILDLLFSEGPATKAWILGNANKMTL